MFLLMVVGFCFLVVVVFFFFNILLSIIKHIPVTCCGLSTSELQNHYTVVELGQIIRLAEWEQCCPMKPLVLM